jgi:hypothetical protein
MIIEIDLISALHRYGFLSKRIKWPEGEPIIMINSMYAKMYAQYVIKGRWPEAEKYIKKNKLDWQGYQYIIDELDDNDNTFGELND